MSKFGLTSLEASWETPNFSQLVSRLVQPNLLSFYVSVFVCIGVFKSRFSQLYYQIKIGIYLFCAELSSWLQHTHAGLGASCHRCRLVRPLENVPHLHSHVTLWWESSDDKEAMEGLVVALSFNDWAACRHRRTYSTVPSVLSSFLIFNILVYMRGSLSVLHGAYSMLQRIFLCHKYEFIIGIGSQVLILLNSGKFFKITKIPNCIQSFKASDKDTLDKPIYSSV